MRVTCQTLEDFKANLTGIGVYRKVVYFDRTKKPNGDKPLRQAASCEVFFQAAAVATFAGDSAQALVVYG